MWECLALYRFLDFVEIVALSWVWVILVNLASKEEKEKIKDTVCSFSKIWVGKICEVASEL